MKKVLIPDAMLEQMSEALKVLGHPRRLKILEYLDLHGESAVNAIVGGVGEPQGAVSQHLKTMRLSGILASRRNGREVCYAIASDHPVTILNCIRRRLAEMQDER